MTTKRKRKPRTAVQAVPSLAPEASPDARAERTTVPTTTLEVTPNVSTATLEVATTVPTTTLEAAPTVPTATLDVATTVPTATLEVAPTVPTTTLEAAPTVPTTTLEAAPTVPTTTLEAAPTVPTTTPEVDTMDEADLEWFVDPYGATVEDVASPPALPPDEPDAVQTAAPPPELDHLPPPPMPAFPLVDEGQLRRRSRRRVVREAPPTAVVFVGDGRNMAVSGTFEGVRPSPPRLEAPAEPVPKVIISSRLVVTDKPEEVVCAEPPLGLVPTPGAVVPAPSVAPLSPTAVTNLSTYPSARPANATTAPTTPRPARRRSRLAFFAGAALGLVLVGVLGPLGSDLDGQQIVALAPPPPSTVPSVTKADRVAGVAPSTRPSPPIEAPSPASGSEAEPVAVTPKAPAPTASPGAMTATLTATNVGATSVATPITKAPPAPRVVSARVAEVVKPTASITPRLDHHPAPPQERYADVPPLAAAANRASATPGDPAAPIRPTAAPARASVTADGVARAPRVYLQSQPQGANVFADGRLRGQTPLALDLDAPVAVLLVHPDHRPEALRLDPLPDTRIVTVSLTAMR